MEMINKKLGFKHYFIFLNFDNGWIKAMYARNSDSLIRSK